MAIIESRDYEETRQRLTEDPTVRSMAASLASSGVDRSVFAHESGTPRFGFMQACNDEYRWRTQHGAGAHIGAVAEAILRLLDDWDWQAREDQDRGVGGTGC